MEEETANLGDSPRDPPESLGDPAGPTTRAQSPSPQIAHPADPANRNPMEPAPLSETETSSAASTQPRLLTYRCSCGGDVRLAAHGEGICAKCGRAISLQGLDATQTVSFCSEVGSGTSFQLLDGPDRSGEELGHFRLLAKLGYGGMGAVYRALDESLQRFVAVKVMRSADEGESSTDKQIARLLEEAVAQARLNHPNVVTIYYVGRDGEEPFFAMELLPGPTLAKLIQDNPLPYDDVVRYAIQVVEALEQASLQGLVHGDIKPSNLILSDKRTVKLGDFGLAKTKQSTPKEGISGTLSYMAPELSAGGEPSDQSDMYSLGITLFELTFGRRPYAITGSTLREQLDSKQIAVAEFPERWPMHLPEGWARLLKRLMSKLPEDRFDNYESLKTALANMAPVGVTSAGLLNRALAYGVDLATWCVLIAILYVPSQLAGSAREEIVGQLGDSPQFAHYVDVFLGRLSLLQYLVLFVPLLAVYFEYRGGRSLGRYLFQLRIVDRHGLRLQNRRRLVRSSLRYVPLFVLSLSLLAGSLGVEQFVVLITPVTYIFLMINMLPALGPRRMALHDRVVHS
ncbi:MAG TPA: hypothetical protein DDW52_19505, partial [Planctomycetaceae bacterium]|nr:hypothetical protein [Planctomycetaceae bacterium]